MLCIICYYIDYIKYVFCTYSYNIQDLPPTPWVSILTSWPVWALIIIEAGHDWGGYTIGSDLPKYMNDVLHFSVTEVSLKKQYIYTYNSFFFKRFTMFIFRTGCCHQFHISPNGSCQSHPAYCPIDS